MTAVIFNLPLLISVHYNELKSMCIDYWSESWMPKANSMAWVIVTGVIPIFLMAGIYFKVVHYLWYENADNGDSAQQVRFWFCLKCDFCKLANKGKFSIVHKNCTETIHHIPIDFIAKSISTLAAFVSGKAIRKINRETERKNKQITPSNRAFV